MKQIYEVEFKGMYPVGNCLFILADSIHEARRIATQTIQHTTEFKIKRKVMDQSGVIVYMSGDY
jgi:hypothetical protein